jgi:hypothetical protein
MREQIKVAAAGGAREELSKVTAQAVATCPTCFQVRVTALLNSTPRWGGSYELMAEIARGADPGKNPRLRLLSGYADLDRADRLRMDKKNDEALAAIDRSPIWIEPSLDGPGAPISSSSARRRPRGSSAGRPPGTISSPRYASSRRCQELGASASW